MSQLTDDVIHAIRQTLGLFGAYHVVFDIMLERVDNKTFRILAIVKPNTTLPAPFRRPEEPIHFLHQCDHEMHAFTDVAFMPIARELAVEMQKALKEGDAYNRQPKIHLQ